MQLSIAQRAKLQFKLFLLIVQKGWSWDHVKRVTHTVLHGGDTSTIRLILANASLLWALFVWINPAVFDRPAYAIMKSVGGHNLWSWAFVLHFLGVYWRTYDPIPRLVAGQIINSYGFLIWFFSSVSLNYYVGGLSPATALEITMCGTAAWGIYATGMRKELISV